MKRPNEHNSSCIYTVEYTSIPFYWQVKLIHWPRPALSPWRVSPPVPGQHPGLIENHPSNIGCFLTLPTRPSSPLPACDHPHFLRNQNPARSQPILSCHPLSGSSVDRRLHPRRVPPAEARRGGVSPLHRRLRTVRRLG